MSMLRKLVVTGAVAGLVAVVVGGGSFASASGGKREDTTFRLNQIQTSVVQVDAGQHGTNAGDEFIFSSRLRNAQNTATVGDANDVCTVLSITGVSMHCVSTITLRAGTIELAGDVSSRSTFTLAITGGTTAYDEVRGQLVATPGPSGHEVLSLDIDR